jgi:hypothetical protein
MNIEFHEAALSDVQMYERFINDDPSETRIESGDRESKRVHFLTFYVNCFTSQVKGFRSAFFLEIMLRTATARIDYQSFPDVTREFVEKLDQPGRGGVVSTTAPAGEVAGVAIEFFCCRNVNSERIFFICHDDLRLVFIVGP